MKYELSHKHRYPWPVIENAVIMYVSDKLTYRNISDHMKNIGVKVSHKTIGEWVYKFAGIVKIKRLNSIDSYSVEESHVRCNGQKMFMYQALDDKKSTVGLFFREKRGMAMAKKYFSKTIYKEDPK